MKAILKKAIILKNSMTLEQYTEQLEERTALLQEFGILINQSLPDKVSKIFPFQKRMKKRQHQVFNFLFYPDVPYDNNGSYPNFFIIPTSAVNKTSSEAYV